MLTTAVSEKCLYRKWLLDRTAVRSRRTKGIELMKIIDVRTVLLTGPCTNDPFLSECRKHRSAAFIEIHTDTGLIGIGEPYNGYRCAELHPPAGAYFAPILMGRNVDDVPQLWKWMHQ